jgi:carboxypeptidase T
MTKLKLIRLSVIIIIMIQFTSGVFAQKMQYSRVKVYTDDSGMRKLSSLGLETDHGDIRKGVWLISDFSSEEIRQISEAGFRYEILISDVVSHYREQNASPSHTHKSAAAAGCGISAPQYPVPSNFSLGSYAGYFTYQEMLDNLDSMASKYPNLITIRQALPGGTTHENRPVFYVKISDNANLDESEPEVLYTSVHHAREPGGMSQLIYYMWYVLENYVSDPSISAIIDHTEMFFVPCLNPDGYLYNEATEPAGGGLWRKNRRDNQDGTFGVDLNRNYGYNWGFDDDGSSPNTNSATYRGPAAFSEPETQLIRDFVNAREFKIALNYHTYGDLLIYPWGYDYSIYTPDSALFADYGALLTTYNGYTFGTADQTVGYIVNGSSDDWMYGEQVTKDKVFAMTPECGDASFGFWPPSNEIIPLCQANMFQNLTMAQLAGRYATLNENSPELISTGGGHINFTLKQLGLDTTGTYTISLSGLTPNVILTGSQVTVSGLGAMQEKTDSISFALTTPMTNGEVVRFLLSIDNGFYTRTDTITKYFGAASVAFASDGNSTSGFNAGQWGISNTVFYTPTASITDSPVGDYNSNDTKTIRLTNAVSLANAVKASLTFYARWALEPNFDYVVVQASTDNGQTWTSLCGKYTVTGSPNQIDGDPLYEGFQNSWVQEEISLDDYLGQNILIRFRLVSDGFLEYDGYYFDDLLITKVLPGTNSVEEVAVNGISVVSPNPASGSVFVSFNAPVAEGSLLIYDSMGKLVQQNPVSEGSVSEKLDISRLAKGVYMVAFSSKGIDSRPSRLVVN